MGGLLARRHRELHAPAHADLIGQRRVEAADVARQRRDHEPREVVRESHGGCGGQGAVHAARLVREEE
jgi:hypothetical protein